MSTIHETLIKQFPLNEAVAKYKTETHAFATETRNYFFNNLELLRELPFLYLEAYGRGYHMHRPYNLALTTGKIPLGDDLFLDSRTGHLVTSPTSKTNREFPDLPIGGVLLNKDSIIENFGPDESKVQVSLNPIYKVQVYWIAKDVELIPTLVIYPFNLLKEKARLEDEVKEPYINDKEYLERCEIPFKMRRKQQLERFMAALPIDEVRKTLIAQGHIQLPTTR